MMKHLSLALTSLHLDARNALVHFRVATVQGYW